MSKTDAKAFTEDFYSMVGVIFWNGLGFFFLDFIIPFVAAIELNATGFEMGVIFSIRTIGYIIVAPFAGHLADRISNKFLVLVGSYGRGFAYFLLYTSIVSESLIGLIAGNFLLGFMAGFFWIPMDVLISQKSNKENRSQAFGIRSSRMGWGTTLGAFIGFGIMGFADIYHPGNNLLLYSALPVFGIANFFAGTRFYKSTDENLVFDEEEEKSIKISNKQSYYSFFKSLEKPYFIGLMLVMIALFLSTTNGSIAKPFLLVYLTTNLESDPISASMAYAPAGVMSMILAPYLGKIADRFDPKLIISFSASIGAGITWFLINTSELFVFALLLIVDMTIATTAGLTIQNVISRLSKNHRGKIFGIETIFADAGSIIGPVFGGILWDSYGYKSPFIFSIVVELLLIPVYIFALIKITPHLAEKKASEQENTVVDHHHPIGYDPISSLE